MKEKIKQKLGIVHLTRDDFNMMCKDRMDFGFDSIYFRYAEAIQELSFFKEMEAKKIGRDFNRKAWVDSKLMHFYNCLEQWTHAHPVLEESNDTSTSTLDSVNAAEAAKAFKEFAEVANEITGGF